MMEESVGKRLSKARVQRGLSIDEAAHATKLRPDKITALENDDYSMFASNVYARGFLQIYGRFLGVDVSEFANTLGGHASISVEDYQYLNSNAPARIEERPAPMRSDRRGPPLIKIAAFLVLLAVLAFGFHFYVNWQRIVGDPAPHKAAATPAASTEAVPAAPQVAVTSPAPATAPTGPVIPATHPSAPQSAAKASVSDRDFVAGAPPTAAPATTTTNANEVLVLPLRKTWIVVRKNDPNSQPIFEDFLYPDTPPLKLKGARFFIEARDPSAIQIRKNGAPMAYQSPGTAVQ